MTRRAFLTLPAAITVSAVTPAEARAGLHVRGMLKDDTSDLQPGYFVLCGLTGVCDAKNAISISVHPDNAICMDSLREKVGREVQFSIF